MHSLKVSSLTYSITDGLKVKVRSICTEKDDNENKLLCYLILYVLD